MFWVYVVRFISCLGFGWAGQYELEAYEARVAVWAFGFRYMFRAWGLGM